MMKYLLLNLFFIYTSAAQCQRLNKIKGMDVAINSQWTWMKGDNQPNQLGIYGTRGVPDVANKPGARWFSHSWTDANNNLWLFGGEGYASTTAYGMLNDLWKYNPQTKMWTWVKGDNVVNVNAVYGTKGVAADGNKPGARANGVTWVDNLGRFWLLGGNGWTTGIIGIVNDLWT